MKGATGRPGRRVASDEKTAGKGILSTPGRCPKRRGADRAFRAFKRSFGVPPRTYQPSYRIGIAQRLLREGNAAAHVAARRLLLSHGLAPRNQPSAQSEQQRVPRYLHQPLINRAKVSPTVERQRLGTGGGTPDGSPAYKTAGLLLLG